MRTVKRSLRQRIGDRFQYYRHQVRGWKSANRAAQEMGAPDSKTIGELEGTGNQRWSSFEEYARGLRVPFEQIVREALTDTPDREDARDPETQRLIQMFNELKDVDDRRHVLVTLERTHAARNRAVSEASEEDAADQSDRGIETP